MKKVNRDILRNPLKIGGFLFLAGGFFAFFSFVFRQQNAFLSKITRKSCGGGIGFVQPIKNTENCKKTLDESVFLLYNIGNYL